MYEVAGNFTALDYIKKLKETWNYFLYFLTDQNHILKCRPN